MKFKDWINHLREAGQNALAETCIKAKEGGAAIMVYESSRGLSSVDFSYTFDGKHYGYCSYDRMEGLALSSSYRPNKANGSGSRFKTGTEFTLTDLKEAVRCAWGPPVKRWQHLQHWLDTQIVLTYFVIEDTGEHLPRRGEIKYWKCPESGKLYRTQDIVFSDGSPGLSLERWSPDFQNWEGHIHNHEKTRATLAAGGFEEIDEERVNELIK